MLRGACLSAKFIQLGNKQRILKQSLCLFGLSHNFCRKVFSALLETFAHFVAGEADDFEPAVDHLGNALIGVLNEGLLKQADFLIILLDAAFNHFFNDCSGIGLGIVLCLFAENLALMLEFGLVTVVLAEAGGLCSRDLHCDIVCNSGELIVADLKKYADFAAEVDIGINDAFNTIEAADGDLFADLCNCAGDVIWICFWNGTRTVSAGQSIS